MQRSRRGIGRQKSRYSRRQVAGLISAFTGKPSQDIKIVHCCH